MKHTAQHKAIQAALKGDKEPRVKGMVYKKLKVKSEEGGKLHKMTHGTENKVKFTGKGGFAKNFGK